VRTLHVNTAATWRGGEQQVLYLLDGLRRRGHDTVLLALEGGTLAGRASALGIEVHRFRCRGDLDLGASRRVRRVLQRGCDVLHLHTGHAHALGVLATLGLAAPPRVVVSRRVDFSVKGGWLGRLKYGRRVHRFIAISHRVEDILTAGGVPADRVTVVHSGVDLNRFRVPADPGGLRRELAVPEGVKLVGFVGALVPHKSPGDLLEALVELPPDVHAVLAGAGPLEETLRRRAADPGLEGRVHFVGHREDIPRLLRSVDVFCLSSRMEGLGTSVLDAMAAGVPVVATRGGGIPEMVEDAVSGLLVPSGEPPALARALLRVLTDRHLADRLAEGGRDRVRRFSAARMVEGTIEVYEKVLNGRA
jgi:glycosyltransferase involved in cell wall biosynthesis